MGEEAPLSQGGNKVLAVIVLIGILIYSVLIFQLGQQSAKPTYTLLPNGCGSSTVATGVTRAYSALKQKASLVALDLWRFADTLVNKTERRILGNMAVNLDARISAMDRVSGQAEQRRLRLVEMARRLLLRISRSQNPTDCARAKFIVTSLPGCGFGCQVHHAAFALRIALAQNRTLFIDGNAWYDIYLPVTNCSKPNSTADVVQQANMYTYTSVGPFVHLG